jgi:hypothetical protein
MTNGRLFVPMYGCGSTSFSLVSDDHGATWKRTGETDSSGNEWVAGEWAINRINRLVRPALVSGAQSVASVLSLYLY